MHDLQAVLALPQEAMYLALGDYLAARVDAVGLRDLTAVEHTLWLAREFHWAVREGGVLGYIVRKTAEHASDAQVALRTIGAAETATVLRDALSARETSANDLDEACSRLSDEAEDSPVLICEYARANRDGLIQTGRPH